MDSVVITKRQKKHKRKLQPCHWQLEEVLMITGLAFQFINRETSQTFISYQSIYPASRSDIGFD